MLAKNGIHWHIHRQLVTVVEGRYGTLEDRVYAAYVVIQTVPVCSPVRARSTLWYILLKTVAKLIMWHGDILQLYSYMLHLPSVGTYYLMVSRSCVTYSRSISAFGLSAVTAKNTFFL